MNERADVLRALKHPGTEGVQIVVDAPLESEPLEQPQRGRGIEVEPAHPLDQFNVFPRGEFGIQLQVWRDESRVHRLLSVSELASVDASRDGSRRVLRDSGKQLDECRLTGTVAPGDAESITGMQRERDVREDRTKSVLLREPCDFQSDLSRHWLLAHHGDLADRRSRVVDRHLVDVHAARNAIAVAIQPVPEYA